MRRSVDIAVMAVATLLLFGSVALSPGGPRPAAPAMIAER